MNRRDRDRNDYEHDYGRYEGYNRNDEHYHSARNLTDTFEQEYQSHRGGNRHHMDHTYHEGDMGDAYERFRREGRGYGDYSGNQRNDRDRDRYNGGSFSRDSYSSNPDYDRGDRDSSRDYGNMRQRYGTSDRYSSSGRDDYRRGRNDRENYFGEGDYDRSSRYSGRDYNSGTGYSGSSGTRGRYESDRDSSGDSWLDSNRRSYLQDRYY
ncbi:hypothetical protein ACFS7Z_18705 [Pontibacter toksunensis]|uniref:SWFGD domain-containing protein n=1 Tax=Pontibacter toksunensis TaxID=1332631 RepID=A0ABW6BZH3_9BACT